MLCTYGNDSCNVWLNLPPSTTRALCPAHADQVEREEAAAHAEAARLARTWLRHPQPGTVRVDLTRRAADPNYRITPIAPGAKIGLRRLSGYKRAVTAWLNANAGGPCSWCGWPVSRPDATVEHTTYAYPMDSRTWVLMHRSCNAAVGNRALAMWHARG
jgi:hypothetical protein